MENPVEGVPVLVQCRIRPRGAGAHGAGDAKVPDKNTLQLLKESGAPGKGDDLYKIGVGSSYQCAFDKVITVCSEHNSVARRSAYTPGRNI